jgi:hypothetical protein
MIDYCEEQGLFFRSRSLPNHDFVFVFEKFTPTTGTVEEIDEVFAIKQSEALSIHTHRLFDILDRIYGNLVRLYSDWIPDNE